MATNTYSTAGTAAESTPVFTNSVMGHLRRTMHRWQEQSRIRAELNMMTTRELADLGLVPSDINDVASGRYNRA